MGNEIWNWRGYGYGFKSVTRKGKTTKWASTLLTIRKNGKATYKEIAKAWGLNDSQISRRVNHSTLSAMSKDGLIVYDCSEKVWELTNYGSKKAFEVTKALLKLT